MVSDVPKLNPETLRALMFANGFSVAGFALEVGVIPSHVSNILAGRRGASPAVIKKMADVLKVPVAALVNAPTGASA